MKSSRVQLRFSDLTLREIVAIHQLAHYRNLANGSCERRGSSGNVLHVFDGSGTDRRHATFAAVSVASAHRRRLMDWRRFGHSSAATLQRALASWLWQGVGSVGAFRSGLPSDCNHRYGRLRPIGAGLLKSASTAAPFCIRFSVVAASSARPKVPLTRDGHHRGGTP
jgi:hypothetical protein